MSEHSGEIEVWMKRIKAAEEDLKTWEEEYRVAEGYNYWRGKQRVNEFDGADRKAMHNKIHPDVAQSISSLYYNHPNGKIVALPERSDTPGETVSRKARLLQDTGAYLVRAKDVGFKENTLLALKESEWAIGCVETGYEADFIDNPMSERPPLKERKETEIAEEVTLDEPERLEELEREFPVRDEMGLTVDEDSDFESLKRELRRLQKNLQGERFYVKHISSKQILVSPSNKAILENNDWVGYWEDYAIEDIKRSTAYVNTEDIKAEGEYAADENTGRVARARIYRIWDLRTKEKIVLCKGHDKYLMKRPFKRCLLRFLRRDPDPYHFRPIPPVYLKLAAQDSYNDRAEYYRKVTITSVPRFTYDQDAVDPGEAAKFQSRDMNVMIPRAGGTHSVIEPVPQPSMAGAALQGMTISEKEFAQAGSPAGDPLNPATQTATRAMLANTKKQAQEGFEREKVGEWLAGIIEDLLFLATEHMNLEKWIAVNVDLDSPMAGVAAQEVIQTYEEITAEKLRDAQQGIRWHVEVEAETLSPVAEAERGVKLMQVVNFISNPAAAALLSQAPLLLKRLLSLGGMRVGEDVDAILQALTAVVRMNTMTGNALPGISPVAGQEAGPVTAAPGVEPVSEIPPGLAGA